MANQILVSVYAINGTTYQTPFAGGVQASNARRVNPVRNSAGSWIGKYKPSNYNLIYSEVEIGKDLMTSEVDFYYFNRTVAQMVTDLG